MHTESGIFIFLADFHQPKHKPISLLVHVAKRLYHGGVGVSESSNIVASHTIYFPWVLKSEGVSSICR
jgi:hypothetical protein